jgi:hypothetical protein
MRRERRWTGGCLLVAGLILAATTAGAVAQEAGANAGGAATVSSAASGAGTGASQGGQGGRGSGTAKHDVDDAREAGRFDRGLRRGREAGPPRLDLADVPVTASRRLSYRVNGRELLLKKLVAPVPRVNPAVFAVTGIGGPPRNAIGLAVIGAGPTVPSTRAGDTRLAPLWPAGRTRVVADVLPPNVWHAGIVTTASATAAPGRGINGTGLVRLGSGPAVISGSTHLLTGINGTTLRRKH